MNQVFEKRIRIINNFFLISLTILAIYYGKERSVFFDGADWLIEIIRNNNNYTPHYRYAVGINGIIPWICSYFTKDIHIILNAFIINYALTPILIFLILRYYFKNEKFVTLYLLGFCFFHLLVFFHPNHDAVTGYYYLILLTTFLSIKNQNEENKYFIKIFILCFLVVLTHLTQYLFLYIILFYVYFYINNNFSLKRVLAIATIALIIKATILSSGYEVSRYTQSFSFFNKLNETLNSNLVLTFSKSLLNYNLTLTILLIIISIILIINKKYKTLIIYILLPLIFILYFMSFYFGTWPHSFATEGYFKSSIIIPIIIFIDYYIMNEKLNVKWRYFLLIGFYVVSGILIYYHGINYKKYYNNINYITKQIDKNTIFISRDFNILEEFYITHRHSTLINMIENNKCYYFHLTNDTTVWLNNAYIHDTIAGGLCFKENVDFSPPNNNIIKKINSQYNLINKYNF